MRIDELIMGTHNVANSNTSIAGKLLNISNESIRHSLMTFPSGRAQIREFCRNKRL